MQLNHFDNNNNDNQRSMYYSIIYSTATPIKVAAVHSVILMLTY